MNIPQANFPTAFRGASPAPPPPPGYGGYHPPAGFAFPRPSPTPGPPPPPPVFNFQTAQPSFVLPRTPQPQPGWIPPPQSAPTPAPMLFNPPPAIQPYWGAGGSTPPPTHNPGQRATSIHGNLAALSFNDSPRSTPRPGTPPSKVVPPSLTAPLPTTQSLAAVWQSIAATPSQAQDPVRKVTWAKDVFSVIERNQAALGLAGDPGPVRITEPALQRLAESALTLVAAMTRQPLPSPVPPFVAEALYLRGMLEAAGSFPEAFPQSPRDAFRDYEASARAGYHAAWFKLGRDYESVGDGGRAKDCFERGARNGIGSCFYVSGYYFFSLFCTERSFSVWAWLIFKVNSASNRTLN